MNKQIEVMDRFIARAKAMVAENEAMVAENDKILKAQAVELVPKRFETRVLKDDGLGPITKPVEAVKLDMEKILGDGHE